MTTQLDFLPVPQKLQRLRSEVDEVQSERLPARRRRARARARARPRPPPRGSAPRRGRDTAPRHPPASVSRPAVL